MEAILEVVEKGNDNTEEKMVDDELQSRNEMIDDASSESGNSKSSSMTDEYLNSKLSQLRLKPSDCAKILRAGDILIKLCNVPRKPGIDSIQFEPLSKLLDDFAPSPAELNPVNTIWAAGWIIKKSDDKFSHTSLNGWMRNIHNSNKKSPSSIVYQPIIDSNPNNYSTINTALL